MFLKNMGSIINVGVSTQEHVYLNIFLHKKMSIK